MSKPNADHLEQLLVVVLRLAWVAVMNVVRMAMPGMRSRSFSSRPSCSSL